MLKFVPYILKNLRRNKVRSILTVTGVAVAVSIFCFLASLESSMQETVAMTAQDTMLVVGQKDQY